MHTMTVLDMNSRLATRARVRSRALDGAFRRAEGLDFQSTKTPLSRQQLKRLYGAIDVALVLAATAFLCFVMVVATKAVS